MAQEITKILKSLQCAAVSRCRERLDEAAVRARGLITSGEKDADRDDHGDKQYGVTSVLKRRHGL